MESLGIMIGTKGLIKKHEFVRIIIQCLYSLGYEKSAACLENESNISCKSREFESLESRVLSASWDDCIEILYRINGMTDETRASALFLVLEQFLFECLNCGDNSLALEILQKRIACLKLDKDKVHKCAFEMLSLKQRGMGSVDCNVIHELRKGLVVDLEKVLPPPISLPERRLEHLVETAVSAQIDNCIYHSSDMVSLYEDHHCDRDQFPTETIQTLKNHMNEVWFVQFSNNGQYLASSSSDCTAIIWKEVKPS